MYQTELLLREYVTHDVQRYILSKPTGFAFRPGQAIDMTIDNERWRDERHPFTLTNRVDDRVLELMIKSYAEHDGITRHLAQLKPGSRLLISDAFDSFHYEGPGWFIAAGAGITPFLAIIRDLADRNELDEQYLIYSNKTAEDIIQQRELHWSFGDRAHFTCTRSQSPLCDFGHVDEDYLREKIHHFGQKFYVCGPPSFVKQVNASLQALGAQSQSLMF